MSEVIISGPEGRIEARYHEGKESHVALLLHPNPKQGGTMNSKVVHAMYSAFVSLGFSVLRFNFRGVGRSEGKFDGKDGELNDAAACLNWLFSHHVDPMSCWVGGFSFGAWVGMQLLMRRPEITDFISVSPPVNLYDFSFLAPCPSPGLIIQGGNDMIVPKEAVVRFAKRLEAQRSALISSTTIRSADHFFRDHLKELSEKIREYVLSRITLGKRVKG
jgi:alpha/beta superfamily hydrolase